MAYKHMKRCSRSLGKWQIKSTLSYRFWDACDQNDRPWWQALASVSRDRSPRVLQAAFFCRFLETLLRIFTSLFMSFFSTLLVWFWSEVRNVLSSSMFWKNCIEECCLIFKCLENFLLLISSLMPLLSEKILRNSVLLSLLRFVLWPK